MTKRNPERVLGLEPGWTPTIEPSLPDLTPARPEGEHR
jgi:hypothetical protein